MINFKRPLDDFVLSLLVSLVVGVIMLVIVFVFDLLTGSGIVLAPSTLDNSLYHCEKVKTSGAEECRVEQTKQTAR